MSCPVLRGASFCEKAGLGLVWRGGVAAKTCAAIGRSEHRVIIAPCFARIANRTDTSPVRLARASPGIDSDAAPRFPASRNPMAAQVFAPCRGAAPESRRKGLVHRGGAAVVGCLLRRDTSRAFPRPAPVARRALSARLVAAVNPARQPLRPSAPQPFRRRSRSIPVPRVGVRRCRVSFVAGALRHIRRSNIPCLPACRRSFNPLINPEPLSPPRGNEVDAHSETQEHQELGCGRSG